MPDSEICELYKEGKCLVLEHKLVKSTTSNYEGFSCIEKQGQVICSLHHYKGRQLHEILALKKPGGMV